MKEGDFFIVDVFAEEKYAGNRLAVVRAETGMDSALMQSIADEFNFSETTFILSETPREGAYDVRIFTPRAEVPFAGHPTLGTAYVLATLRAAEMPRNIVLSLRAGRIPVEVSYEGGRPEVLVMSQPEPVFGGRFDAGVAAAVLGLEEADIDVRFPVEQVSTGLPFIIIPVRTLEAMRRIKVDLRAYYGLIQGLEAKALLAFAPETYDSQNQLNVRMFADCYGIAEDPATGSGNGCLAGYLLKHGYYGGGPLSVRAEQGREVGRPSVLMLEAQMREKKIGIRVGGRVVPMAEGRLL